MKTTPFLLCAVLMTTAGASLAGVQLECKQARGRCGPPPAPPAPPAPPSPPALPAPPAPFAAHAMAGVAPVAPALPALPPVPPVPELPAIPAGAHKACAGKADGATLTWTIRAGETMTGICENDGGKMVFQLRSHRTDD